MKEKIEEKVSEEALNVFDTNTNYIERCTDTIYKHFKENGHTWGFKEEPVTRAMIEETILDLIDTILDSDEKIDCDEAGTGRIIVQLSLEDEEYDLTIMLEL